jgi:CDP-glucose 4,6-dehydratase
MIKNVFKNKTVLVTGHTGFKGSWLCIWLKELGAKVVGYALKPHTDRDNYVVAGLEDRMNGIIGNVQDFHELKKVFEAYQPEFVFHLAAQAIVRESYENPKDTFDVNVGGTVNVLECCRLTDSVRVIINVTSDKCYENREWFWGYRENDPMGGDDPYSASKGCSELVTHAYEKSFFNPNHYETHRKSLSSVRAGNVIGGGDWQRHRIIPDCIRALEKGEAIQIRNPDAVRPWQHVLEPLSGYLLLASRMDAYPRKFCGAWNFGPNHDGLMPVGKVADEVVSHWGNGSWVDASDAGSPHEAKLLSLEISKARSCLKWIPIWNTTKAIAETVNWYKNYRKNDPYKICMDQIERFMGFTRGHHDD